MNLPNDSIGISDILSYRECPRRMSYGMRRHTGQGTQSDDRTPEAGSWATVYGSAIHEAIAATEDGYDDEAAIKQTWKVYGSKLMPSDLDLLRRDLETYHSRDFPNTRTVASEPVRARGRSRHLPACGLQVEQVGEVGRRCAR
jgi:hypothetical protein